MALYVANYESRAMYVNLPIWLVLCGAKVPAMYRVRLFGINSTPGIDDDVNDEDRKAR